MERVVDPRQGADRLALRVHRRVVKVVRAVAENRLGDRRTRERYEDEQDDRDPSTDRDLVSSETTPDLLPVAASFDLDLAELDARFERHCAGHACARAEDFLFGSLCHERGDYPFVRESVIENG